VAVTNTGLADWLVTRLPIDALGPAGVAVLMAYLTCVLSNFMSNTAAANILVPIALVVSAGSASLVLPIALASSCAMAMPVSTPPNAIAYATGRIKASDFLLGGAILGILGPGIATIWAALVMP
jgi:sodium-dependent dicarboxylate transporter 2/3/5